VLQLVAVHLQRAQLVRLRRGAQALAHALLRIRSRSAHETGSRARSGRQPLPRARERQQRRRIKRLLLRAAAAAAAVTVFRVGAAAVVVGAAATVLPSGQPPRAPGPASAAAHQVRRARGARARLRRGGGSGHRSGGCVHIARLVRQR
jgi:hypothetical protein